MSELFDEVKVIKEQMEAVIINFQPKTPPDYMTRLEVAEMLSCDLSTIHSWTRKGKLIPYGIGNRVYYKRNEVEAALVPFGKNKGENI
ncbi:MAG: helix-turn-helix domain-containing protein [Bacteroidia bacterium]|nr:helix-turn-helix domain-containing protein [Bacteroidota bacterium]MBP6412067.1 helix-turn-helix domain-containing protein [Bacteroidia bacterium]